MVDEGLCRGWSGVGRARKAKAVTVPYIGKGLGVVRVSRL